MLTPLLIDLQFLPPVQYFARMSALPYIFLEQHEHYAKGGYRNRCHIATVNGVQRLSIPLQGGKHQQQPIREVRIAYDERWQQQHWRSIQSAYGNSPFFEHYAGDFQPFFEKKEVFLFDLNLKLLQTALRLLHLPTELRLTEDYSKEAAGILDFRGKIHPKNTAPDSHFQAVRYPQVFEDRWGFLPELSILDLLFCTGPRAASILKGE